MSSYGKPILCWGQVSNASPYSSLYTPAQDEGLPRSLHSSFVEPSSHTVQLGCAMFNLNIDHILHSPPDIYNLSSNTSYLILLLHFSISALWMTKVFLLWWPLLLHSSLASSYAIPSPETQPQTPEIATSKLAIAPSPFLLSHSYRLSSHCTLFSPFAYSTLTALLVGSSDTLSIRNFISNFLRC